jgi:CRISPR-associated protein Cmr4
MSKKTRIFWLHALTPLHVGAGRGVGYIDLPIMREKVTDWPLVPGSAVKGVLRDHHEEKKTPHLDAAFGMGGDEHANSGSLVFTDARIVCLPVRSLYGTFAWCTSSMALQRLARDLKLDGVSNSEGPKSIPGESEVWVPNGVASKLKDEGSGGKAFLEDLDFEARENDDAEKWAKHLAGQVFAGDKPWQHAFIERFAILPDNAFDFLCKTGTEVAARVRINAYTKTVDAGALWYEESLPTETILGGLVWCDRVFGVNGKKSRPEDLLKTYCGSDLNLQIGGKSTVGHGRVRCVFSNGGQ